MTRHYYEAHYLLCYYTTAGHFYSIATSRKKCTSGKQNKVCAEILSLYVYIPSIARESGLAIKSLFEVSSGET